MSESRSGLVVVIASLTVFLTMLSCSPETELKNRREKIARYAQGTKRNPMVPLSTGPTPGSTPGPTPLPTLLGQCWFAPLPMDRGVRCYATFTTCRGVGSSPEPCNLWLWVWCGRTFLFEGDYVTSRTLVRIALLAVPIGIYSDLPILAVMNINDTPVSGPAVLNYQDVNRFGACVVQPSSSRPTPSWLPESDIGVR